MGSRSIDKIFESIIDDYQAIAVETIKGAAKKTQKDIVKEAQSYLAQYYRNYKPKVYKRTHKLKNAIVLYWDEHSGVNGVSIEVGVQYKSSALKGMYQSNSFYHKSGDTWKVVEDYSILRSDYGVPEPEWILDNFLQGIHPWGQEDGAGSTESLMQKFIDTDLPNRIKEYVQEELFNAIVNRLKVMK